MSNPAHAISLAPVRPLDVNPDARVWHRGKPGRVLHGIDLERVRIHLDDMHKDASTIVPIVELEASAPELILLEPAGGPVTKDIQRVSDAEWEAARLRLDCIKPLLEKKITTKMCQDRIKEFRALYPNFKVSKTSLFHWKSLFLETNRRLSSLLPARSDGGRGGLRIHEFAKQHLQHGIDQYLDGVKEHGRRYEIPDIIEMVQHDCEREIRELKKQDKLPDKYTVPSANTIRNRIAALDPNEVDRRRHGQKAAHKLKLEKNPRIVEFPLQVVQIDHTKLDVHLVDKETREVIGRPYITVGIDVFSRVLTAMYVSLDPVGALAVGMCIAQSLLPKDQWLLKRGITASWPVYGTPGIFHYDNAKEFRSDVLKRACLSNETDLEFRPIGECHYGGTIESMMGHFGRKMKGLPGASFSNIAERDDYKSEEHASMDLDQLEYWLARFICIYHRKPHSSLGMTPLEKFKEGVLGSASKPGTGYPLIPKDPERVRIDFLPWKERSIQPYGIRFENIEYSHDVLKTLVGTHGHFVRFDPRDISVLYFLDEKVGKYYAIPYRNTGHPPASIWEVNAAKKRAKERGLSTKAANEEVIFQMIAEQREIVDTAQRLTKTARRDKERRKRNVLAVKLPPDSNGPIDPTVTPAPMLPFTPEPNKVYEAFEDD